MARPSSLVQILDNLINNACMWLEGSHRQRQITITLNKDMYTVIVADNGPGIPSHMRENIFKPFVSMRNGGRGLGLYISRELLRAMKGDIFLAPQQNNEAGARFILQFPQPRT